MALDKENKLTNFRGDLCTTFVPFKNGLFQITRSYIPAW